MTAVVTLALWLLVVLVAAPVLVVWLQVLLAWPRRGDGLPSATPDGAVADHAALRCAVLVPAHDEAAVIGETVRLLRAQLQPGDTLLVVADNCSDDTARRSREAGADVVERSDAARRGKGYALDFGVRHLAQDAFDALVIVDADCHITPADGVRRLARSAAVLGRPVQCLDLMHAPEGAGLKTRVAAFAWRLKNWVRPLGALAMAWPCQLMGTGMAFPWGMARQMPLASGELVEDMQLGIALALAGTPPLFCPQVLVSSEFPDAAPAVQSQRRRWEHGHLGMIVHHVPRLLGQAIARRDGHLLALALDLAVPPLALLVLLLVVVNALALLAAWLGGGAAPLALAMACLALLAASVLAAWWGWGRAVVSMRDLLAVPWYVLSKLPLYLGYWLKRQKEWVRTQRK